MKSKFSIALAAFMVFGLSMQSHAVMFDFQGLGGAGFTADVATWDYLPSSALAVFDNPLPIATGDNFQLYTHGVVGSFIDPNSQVIDVSSVPDFEVTAVGAFRETVFSSGAGAAGFAVTPGPINFFQMYIDDPDADVDLAGGSAGTGFSDGTLLLSGHVVSGIGAFVSPLESVGQLDQFGGDEASGAAGFHSDQDTISGAGGSNIGIFVAFDQINRDYFYDVPDDFAMNVLFNASQILPFNQVDPSNYFFDGTNELLLTALGAFIAQVNGLDGFGPDGETPANALLFQVDANQTQALVPEPGTMILFGSGLLGFAVLGRKRRAGKRA